MGEHKTRIPFHSKPVPKQVPLFEELDDGNLIPYDGKNDQLT